MNGSVTPCRARSSTSSMMTVGRALSMDQLYQGARPKRLRVGPRLILPEQHNQNQLTAP